MRRVLRCDGIIPQYYTDGRDPAPQDVREMRAWLAEHGARSDLDVVSEGETPAGNPAAATARVTPWAEAGCTWWLETRWEMPHHSPDRMSEIRQRLAAGPLGGVEAFALLAGMGCDHAQGFLIERAPEMP